MFVNVDAPACIVILDKPIIFFPNVGILILELLFAYTSLLLSVVVGWVLTVAFTVGTLSVFTGGFKIDCTLASVFGVLYKYFTPSIFLEKLSLY